MIVSQLLETKLIPKKLIIFLVTLFALCGCAHKLPMESVIDVCANQNDKFTQISACIKDTYSKEGKTPNANSVKAFYAELAVLDEDYRNGKITDAQAKAGLYRSYSETVEKSNRANKGTVCMPINGMVYCK